MAEACDALRAVTGCSEEKLLRTLLRASNYNVERAANMCDSRGRPGRPHAPGLPPFARLRV